MEKAIALGIEQYFGELEDPRIDRTKLHKLLDILVIAICAVIPGADNWEGIEEFGQARPNGSKASWNCPMGFLHMTHLIGYLRV